MKDSTTNQTQLSAIEQDSVAQETALVPASEAEEPVVDGADDAVEATADIAEAPVTSAIALSGDDLSRLLAEAEQRGYDRAVARQQPPVVATPREPVLYEEPDSLEPPPSGWKTSPLLSTRRPSIWDR